MQSANELQLQLTIQTGEEHRVKQRKIIEKQKQDLSHLQLEYDKALYAIKDEEKKGMKQLQWFQSALTKKQSELENQVKQKPSVKIEFSLSKTAKKKWWKA